jgi:hypothetical protein
MIKIGPKSTKKSQKMTSKKRPKFQNVKKEVFLTKKAQNKVDQKMTQKQAKKRPIISVV